MKWKLCCSFLLIGFLVSCNNLTEISLQKEETSIHNEPTEFEFPEITTGTISFDYYIKSGFIGSLLFQNQDEIVFEYQMNTSRKLYPVNNEIKKWQHISLNWNFENSSLSVFIDEQLQTTRLIKSEKITSINKFILNPDQVKTENSIKIKNVSYKGVNSQLPHRLKIVTFGNSTTAYRNTITGVYSQRLPGLLLKEGIPNIIYNEGVGGSHTGRLVDNDRHKVKHAMDRLESRVLAKNPDITVVCFGINDSWIDTGKDKPRIPLDDFEKNLNYIVETIQKEGSSVLLMTPNALGKRHEK
ncbi:MAG: SGNH/GDSL hydrolase family protein, partial [Cyclobacteriaceae bacterium]|nr:SGNH/GDSL hydrolase family protein [Cyclobacteriaceae bacterium]